MVNTKIRLGMLAMALVFVMPAVGCGNGTTLLYYLSNSHM